MGCALWNEFPMNVLRGSELGNNSLCSQVTKKLEQLLEFTSCTHEVNAIIAPDAGGLPRRAMKRRRVKSETSSRWTALVERDMKT